MDNIIQNSESRYRIIRTLRVRNENIPGVLGTLATCIGSTGANIGDVQTIQIGHRYITRDIDVFVNDEAHLEQVFESLSSIRSVSILEVRDEVLDLHHGGKIEIVSRRSITSQEDLRKVYTPGVADVCRRISEDPSQIDLYTCIPNLVAIVTDGTAVLGLGNIGPLASMPVMEGKAALLRELVGINGFPILLDTNGPEQIVESLKHISITFGAIQLEDIAAPRCFTISKQLSEQLPIPVMHDDQDGTAVVALAAMIKASRLCDIDLSTATIGQIGLGAAGIGVTSMAQHYSNNPVLGTDIVEERMTRLESTGGIASTLEEIMAKSQIVVATTGVKNLISPQLIRPGQIIFALSNPEPEIDPELALSCGAALAADGKSVNNLLGFPGIWKGVLDSKSAKITREMLVSAATTLATIGNVNDLLPAALDKNVHMLVAKAVAKVAIESGVARKELDEDYFEVRM